MVGTSSVGLQQRVKPSTRLAFGYLECPIGALLLAGDEVGLRMISFPSGRRTVQPHPSWRQDDAFFKDAYCQLKAYFAGEMTTFSLRLCIDGTAFQQSVWRALTEIPYGATTTYGALAATIGKPTASRAVGAANGANPLPLVVPCHRVIGKNRSLTGFGGGLDTKRFLLDHEQRILGRDGDQTLLSF